MRQHSGGDRRRTQTPGSTYHPEVVSRIESLCYNDLGHRVSAATIAASLRSEAQEPDSRLAGLRLPPERTIREICAITPPPEKGEAWTLATGTVDEARVVMATLPVLVERTGGRRTFVTRDEAAVLVRLAVVADGLDPYDRFRLARQILAAGGDWQRASLVHHYIAFAPWTGDEAAARYGRAPVPARYETEDEILAAEARETGKRRATRQEGDQR